MSEINLNLKKLTNKIILLAHSGGVDSCVLGDILIRSKIKFSVAHCNFQLRGEESDNDLLFVKKWCKKNRIKFYHKIFNLKDYMLKNKKGVQESARDLRYNWFNHLTSDKGFDYLVTAHHLNDQFETFLMNASRASGIFGLVGIPESNKLLRPLLNVTKMQILDYAKKNNLEWREDSSNTSEDYFRNIIRHQVVKPFENHKPKTLENFKKTLVHLKDAQEFISHQFDKLKKELFIEKSRHKYVDIESLKKIKPLSFSLHHFFSPMGFNTKEVEKLLFSSPGKLILSKKYRLIRDRKHLILSPLLKIKINEIIIDLDKKNLKLPIPIKWEDISNFEKKAYNSNEVFLDRETLKSPISLRKYKNGDYFYPSGMKGKKLLSKFFKDEKYSLLDKEEQWLLCSNGEIVWIIGKRCDNRFLARPNTNNKLLMRDLR